jgi:hypothetical protein
MEFSDSDPPLCGWINSLVARVSFTWINFVHGRKRMRYRVERNVKRMRRMIGNLNAKRRED